MTKVINWYETEAWVAGVDEAGRGPLAGPVIAAAVILHPHKPISGIADSKTLNPNRRKQLYQQILTNALAWSTGRAEVSEIDQINILQASLLAMQRAVQGISPLPKLVIVDGNTCPNLPCPAKTVVGGDRTIGAISAASILAKVIRDQEMEELDKIFPEYGFANHKGYPTASHIKKLNTFGISPVHRRTFGPVRKCVTASLF